MNKPARIIETPVFLYADLDDKAKERARDWYRDGMEFPWSDEYRESLAAFCDVFPVRARDWQVGAWDAYIDARFTGEDDVKKLTGARLVAYLVNNFGRVLWEAKTYRRYRAVPAIVAGADGAPVMNRAAFAQPVERKSRAIQVETCCPFTGFCADEDILQPIRDYIKKPDARDFEDLLSDCLDKWARAMRDDMRHYESEEAISESMEANEYTFTADGRRFG